MHIKQSDLLAAVARIAANIMHSDDDLAQKLETSVPEVQGPEAGPSNDELVENSHVENGQSPVLDGEIRPPERANVNAIRETIETQAEMEVGKPIEEKQEEVEAKGDGPEAVQAPTPAPTPAALPATVAPTVFVIPVPQSQPAPAPVQAPAPQVIVMPAPQAPPVPAAPTRQIIINIATKQPVQPIGGEKHNPRSDVTSGGMGTGAFGGTDLAATPNFEKYSEAVTEPNPDTVIRVRGLYVDGISPSSLMKNFKLTQQQFDDILKGKYGKGKHASAKTAAQSYAEYQKLVQERNQIISQNRSRQMKGEQRLPVPPKPEVPMVPVAYAADGTYEGRLQDPADCPAGCTVKWEPSKGASMNEIAKMAADYWGYDDWITGHTALMLDNDSVTLTAMGNLARNALKKKMTPKEMAAQMQRIPSIKKMGEQSADFYAENAAEARGARGKYEREQLEGKQVVPSGNKARDFVDELTGMWYDQGGQSSWEEPAGEVNWEEIAASKMESERAENPKKYPQTNKQDDKFMKDMGIKMTSIKAATTVLAKVAAMSVPDKHQLRIAIDSLKANPAMLGVMGGPSKEEALQILAKHGMRWDDADYMAGGKGVKKATEKKAGEGEAKTPEEIEKEAGFNMFFPGQVLREIAPELQHNIVDYPNDTNTPMQYADVVGDKDEVPEEMALAAALEGALDTTIVAYVSTSPAGAAGIGRDGKPEVLEGAPLRKENDIRGMMFTDEFYGQQTAVPGSAFASLKASKIAGADEAKQFAIFLKKVCGEIAATFVAMFKVTSRPMLDQVPGKGEIQLAQVEQPQGLSSFNIYNQSSRVKYLMDKLTDSEIKDAINGSSAQGAVWHDGEEGGYVYEVFVRIDDIDTESLIATYSFITGSKE